MSLLQRMLGLFLRPYIRRKARGKTLEQVIDELESSAEQIMPRIDRAQDTAGNREAINHFIGIERWSANRLRVAKGEANFELDSNRRYRLPEDSSLAALQAAFRETRRETLELARGLQQDRTSAGLTVQHNDLGPLTVIEWLAYIRDHPVREIMRITEQPG